MVSRTFSNDQIKGLEKAWPDAPAVADYVCGILVSLWQLDYIHTQKLVKTVASIGYLVGRNEADFKKFLRELELQFFSF